MLSLHELQRNFVNGLLDREGMAVVPLIGDHGLPAAERFAIYRNNCREGFHVALAAGYPVLRRLTGEAFFRQLAGQYQREHPSPSGNLFHAGERLPEWLEGQFAGTQFQYFTDVARLEWACQEVLSAADAPALELQRLGAVSPADHARLCFVLDPALRLFRSAYPVVRIWEAHQQPGDPAVIDLAAGGEQAAVQRRRDGVVMLRLPAAEYACLAAFREAACLDTAATRALEVDAGFDLRGALRRWAQWGFIVDFFVSAKSADR